MKNYTIWISRNKQDNLYMVEVWDEDENERDENMEVGAIKTKPKAESILNRIVGKYLKITFKRLKNRFV